MHRIFGLFTQSVALITDQGNNHAVEVEEEHEEVEAKLDEGFLLVHVQLAENLGRIQKVLVLVDLLGVEQHEGQVQHDGEPVSVDHEEEGQEGVDSGFGDDVGVQAVAKVDRVDVIAFEITVHNREEHLEEEVDGVDQYRQQVKPCFAGHHCEIDVASSIIGNISIEIRC